MSAAEDAEEEPPNPPPPLEPSGSEGPPDDPIPVPVPVPPPPLALPTPDAPATEAAAPAYVPPPAAVWTAVSPPPAEANGSSDRKKKRRADDGDGCRSCSCKKSRCLKLFTFGLNRSMDLAPFKLDIDELLNDYAKENCTSFTDFKRVWMAKKFSYIYEGRPKTNLGVFMQSLFLHCIGHMTSQGSICQRLAGLYCLYCLYECQPYKPHFKIYLSLEESKQLKEFVVVAKQSGIGLVPALVKRMLEKGMFLFGFINLLGDNGAKQVDELNAFHTKRVKFACDKLFANTQIGRYTHTDLGEELELDTIKKLSMDYAKAKELAIAEASQRVDLEDAKHILQNDKLLGDRVEEIVREWDAQKEEFYQKTGVSPGDELAVVDNDESGDFLDENNGHTELAVIDNDKSVELYDENDGFDELEQLLLE